MDLVPTPVLVGSRINCEVYMRKQDESTDGNKTPSTLDLQRNLGRFRAETMRQLNLLSQKVGELPNAINRKNNRSRSPPRKRTDTEISPCKNSSTSSGLSGIGREPPMAYPGMPPYGQPYYPPWGMNGMGHMGNTGQMPYHFK
jgi:hypothetical protein